MSIPQNRKNNKTRYMALILFLIVLINSIGRLLPLTILLYIIVLITALCLGLIVILIFLISKEEVRKIERSKKLFEIGVTLIIVMTIYSIGLYILIRNLGASESVGGAYFLTYHLWYILILLLIGISLTLYGYYKLFWQNKEKRGSG